MSRKSRQIEGGSSANKLDFRRLVEGITDFALCTLDLDGHITNWNAGGRLITGYTARQILGKHFSVFYLPEDREAGLPQQALEIARTKKHFLDEGWRIRKDGTRFFASVVIDPIYDKRKLVGYTKITRDMTERQQFLADLDATESQFRLLVSGVTDYALYMLTPAGIVANWNAGGKRIKGYKPEEIIGQNFSRFYTPADQATGKPARALKIAEETGHYQEEGWRVRKDGSFFWASVVIDAIRDEQGKLLGFAKITRDITERRDAEERLEKVRRQLAESQKMDALGQLTGGVAHDFNNVLMIISGNLHKIRKELTSERGLKALGAIEVASQRAASLTSQLLTFARRQSVNPRAVDVASRIRSVREVLASAIGKAIALQVDIQPDLSPIFVDIGEFETALINLVVNARDAMPEGGVLTISARNEPDEGQIVISVADTGMGIPKDVLGRVFDPFFTTKPVGKGTGLGLSQVHGFVHQAGGTIEIESALGKGTTVCLRLPRSTMTEERTPDYSCRHHASATVLLVEDNPAVADASAGLLEQLGYTVRWVPNAETALQEIEGDGIDLVFSDIIMPGKMDGLKLARAIREKNPTLPVLLTTGYSDSAKHVRADFPVLRKPYQLHELSREISRLTRHD